MDALILTALATCPAGLTYSSLVGRSAVSNASGQVKRAVPTSDSRNCDLADHRSPASECHSALWSLTISVARWHRLYRHKSPFHPSTWHGRWSHPGQTPLDSAGGCRGSALGRVTAPRGTGASSSPGGPRHGRRRSISDAAIASESLNLSPITGNLSINEHSLKLFLPIISRRPLLCVFSHPAITSFNASLPGERVTHLTVSPCPMEAAGKDVYTMHHRGSRVHLLAIKTSVYVSHSSPHAQAQAHERMLTVHSDLCEWKSPVGLHAACVPINQITTW